MKCNYEKLLKVLLTEYSKTKDKEIYLPELFKLYSSNKSVFKAFEILSAKELITLDFDVFKNLCSVELTNKGVTYFSDKRQDRFRFWLPIIISIIALIGAYRQELVAIIQAIVQLPK